VTAHVGRREPLHVDAGPDDALAERVLAERQPAGDVVDVDLDVVLVVILAHLLEDERALELDVAEPRPGQELGQDREALPHHVGGEAHREQRVVAAGLGVQGRAQRLDRGVERQRVGVPLGAAEQHVLDEVRQAAVLGRLEPRADLDERRHRHGVQVRQRDGRHPQPIAEGGRGHSGIDGSWHRARYTAPGRDVRPEGRG
jgi:hypothetical protein